MQYSLVQNSLSTDGNRCNKCFVRSDMFEQICAIIEVDSRDQYMTAILGLLCTARCVKLWSSGGNDMRMSIATLVIRFLIQSDPFP